MGFVFLWVWFYFWGGRGFAVGSDVRFGFCSCFVLFVSTSTEVSVEEKNVLKMSLVPEPRCRVSL